MKRIMNEAGFVKVVEERIAAPTTPWAKGEKEKLVGAYQQMHWTEGVESLSIGLFTRVLGMSYEDVKTFVAKVKRAMADRSIHAYSDFHIVYGQKPL